MYDIKKNNSGFSLVELIIVVAIMGVLLGIIAPAYVSYVQRSKRVADVDSAVKIRDAIIRVQAIDGWGTHGGGYLYTGGVAWNCDSKYNNPPKTFLDALMCEMGTVPVSKINKKYFFMVEYDVGNGEVKTIKLTDHPGSAKCWELYPDASDWIQNGMH